MSNDLQSAVDNAVAPPKVYFGQVTFDVWFCVPVKGVGLVPFDGNSHKPEQRRTAVHITVTPLPSANVTFVTERKMLAESREWASVTLPSYKILGFDSYTQLHEKYVKYELVPTGRTYEAKDANGQPTGEIKEATTFRFLSVYNSEEEAEAAARALYGGGNGDHKPSGASVYHDTPNPDREVALKFLSALAIQSGGNREELAKIIANNPLLSQHFSIDSPEVAELLTPKAAEVPF